MKTHVMENSTFINMIRQSHILFSGNRIRIGLARLKQLNREDLEDHKEKSLRGLCGLGGSNSSSAAQIQ
jgi:hypothetical protein